MVYRLILGLAFMTGGFLPRLGADEAEAIQAIQAAGGLVLKISADSEDREIAFHLAGDKVGDEQLKLVSQVSNVIWLNLAGTGVSDGGLAELKKLSKLEKLHLERTKIGDAGLAHLAKFENLQYLNVYGTKVTDAGLPQLAGLKNLKKLFVWQTEVTDAGIKSLNAALPELEVVVGAKLEPPPLPAIPPPPPVQAPVAPEKSSELTNANACLSSLSLIAPFISNSSIEDAGNALDASPTKGP